MAYLIVLTLTITSVSCTPHTPHTFSPASPSSPLSTSSPPSPTGSAASAQRYTTATEQSATGQAIAQDVPLRRHNNHLYARSMINGQDGGFFLFDTGASLNIVAQGLANRLGLPTTKNNRGGHAIGIGGSQAFSYRQVTSWTLVGHTQYVPLHVNRLASIPLNLNRHASVDKINPGGIVGFPALIDRPFTLDDGGEKLTIHPRKRYESQADETRQPMMLRGRLPYVWAEIFDGQQWIRLRLLIDTGQDREITLPLRLLQNHPGLASVPVAGNGRAAGIGGIITTRETWLRSLRIFDTELRDLPVSFEPSTQLSGRVGMALLQNFRITFDAPRHTIYTRWQPQ